MTRVCTRARPQPPILIRRALEEDTLPLAWNNDKPVKVFRGTDIFMLFWNLHRSPILWGDDADSFRPARWGPCLVQISMLV